MKKNVSVVLAVCLFVGLDTQLRGDVASSSKTGFAIKITKVVNASSDESFDVIVNRFNRWWDSAHSVSGKAENLSIDLEKACMLEVLPDGGFIRHLEIVRYVPGRQLRMSGGLGPLQEMAVTGALTINVTTNADSKETTIELIYNVTGYLPAGLDQLADPVNRVLSEQMDRLVKEINRN
jgi:hypothetical protein